MRILIAEDEKNLRTTLAKQLAQESYSVDACADGEDALHYIELTDYDAIILDILMPKKDGITVLEQMRRAGNQTPVLLLTALGGVDDRVRGLNCGADDYLVKPFAFSELAARLRVMLRRKATSAIVANEMKLADLVVNLDTHEVRRNGALISLTQKEFSLLAYMMHNVGVVLSRERIEQHIWNYDYDGASNVIDVYIRCLRKKIDAGFDVKLIHTVRGAGYVMRAE